MEPVRVAILGNSFATKVQLPALRWAGANHVVGIAGRDREKARRTAEDWDIGAATDDWRELLELAPDLVLVSTPVALHKEMTLAALDAGAAVLCEKPFALDAGEGEEMLAAATASVRGAWIDHQLRWSPHVRAMRRLTGDGALGEPLHARVEMLLSTTGFRARPWSWWFDAEQGGGMLGAIGSHLVDQVRYLFGEIEAVRCELRTFRPERPDAAGKLHAVTADEFVSLSLRFANGALGEVVCSFAVPDARDAYLQLTGSEGALRLVDGLELSLAHGGEEFEPVAVEPPLTSTEYGM